MPMGKATVPERRGGETRRRTGAGQTQRSGQTKTPVRPHVGTRTGAAVRRLAQQEPPPQGLGQARGARSLFSFDRSTLTLARAR